MKFKKILLLTTLFLCTFISIFSNFSYAENEDIETFSPVALLMDAKTGKVLYEKNGYEQNYPASTTKLMTAILTVENCDLSDIATVSYNAVMSVPYDYTNAALQVDEELTIEQLLNVLLIPSANDAGNVLAEHIAGSIESFATMMNTKALEIGCKNTHFTNPSGIHNDGHYSTAYDLALIGRYAMQYDTIKNIVTKTSYRLPATNKYETDNRYFVTTNSMLRESFKSYYYEYVTGLKTGYTEHALDCIVATAKKDDMELIVVILHAGYNPDGLRQKYLDCKTLFEYGFNNYTLKTIATKDTVCKTIEVNGATKETKNLDLLYKNDISIFLSNKDAQNSIEPTITLKDNLCAPITQGEIVGKAEYVADDITYSSDLVAASTVEAYSYIGLIFKILAILLILGILYCILGLTKPKKKKNKKRKIKYI